MKKRKTLKGSMTIFLTLMLASILAVVFTLLEAARAKALRLFAAENAAQVMESVFAEYDQDVFSQYEIFCCGIGEGESRFYDVYNIAQHVTGAAYGGGRNFFLNTAATDIKVGGYQLLSDAHGAAFLKQAADCAAQGLLRDAVEKAAEYLADAHQKEKESEGFDNIEENAVQAVKTIEEAGQVEDADSQKEQPPAELPAAEAKEFKEQYGNPMDSVKNIKRKGILNIVLPPSQPVSGMAVDKSSLLTERSVETGTAAAEDISAAEKLLVLHYINGHFGSYRQPGTQALAYEQEYLVVGKERDEANLKGVANRLLLVREACNYAALQQDSKKVALAEALAAAICGAAAPVLIGAVQQGILLAWAYGESVLDVRTLLSGGSIAFIKDASQWTLELDALKDIGSGFMTAKQCESGLSYENYLDLFLLMQAKETTAMRSLSLIEANIRTIDGRAGFRVDRTVVSMDAEIYYEAAPVFLQLVPQLSDKGGRYHYTENTSYSYLD